LLPAIDRLLAQTGLRLAHLDGLACSIGPGSFTGVRVGVATCLGLRDATGLPLSLVPTLEAMAWHVGETASMLCPVLVCRKGEVYWAIFRRTQHGLDRVVGERVGSPAALAQSLTAGTMLFGEGWLVNEEHIRQSVPPSVVIAGGPAEAGTPSAESVGLLGLERLRRGDVAGAAVTPQYVQRAEAELRYEQSGGVSPVARRQERVTRKVGARLARVRPAAGRPRKDK
jgi:tRNA threonylcarbamoyladenosine biosynthesis protein TsaB